MVASDPSADLRAESSRADDRCLTFAGQPSDLDLRGLARTHPARCCPSDYGFDPELARASCGFAEYLGESEELACVHRFWADDGQMHELRLTPFLGLDLDRAVALHELGAGPVDAAPEQPGFRGSTLDGWRWAFVDGWSIVRRLAWDPSACSPEQMLPVLARMQAAADDPRAAVALPRVHHERDDDPGPLVSQESLLARPIDPPEPGRRYPLPRAAETLVLELLRTAILGDLGGFSRLLEPGARLGLPDRRQLGARAIAGDEATSIQALLDGAARFPLDATLRCPEIDRRAKPRVTRGEASMWCFWISEDGLDLLVFELRGQASEGEADGRVAYVGVFPIRPAAPLVTVGEPPPPPFVPTPELVCGDPHAHAYPGVCPQVDVDVDEEEDVDVDDP